MVKCTNGMNTITVTEGAFKDIFSYQGYVIVEEKENAKEEHKENKKENKFKSLEEKPIGSWTKQEVKEYASEKGINLVGTKNVDEAKERIKEYILKFVK